ncbi:hypothetical protein HDU93_002313 [Gonapodya sp. JEL0774]|nr:hypothetical protein HDU93_002313 [Gonapodya sp. JEL0774]
MGREISSLTFLDSPAFASRLASITSLDVPPNCYFDLVEVLRMYPNLRNLGRISIENVLRGSRRALSEMNYPRLDTLVICFNHTAIGMAPDFGGLPDVASQSAYSIILHMFPNLSTLHINSILHSDSENSILHSDSENNILHSDSENNILHSDSEIITFGVFLDEILRTVPPACTVHVKVPQRRVQAGIQAVLRSRLHSWPSIPHIWRSDHAITVRGGMLVR